MDNRWQMSRIGFVHFWLYDEETFDLADGKLLLRGQNGSGKSITTQSFIPFILDGDRTPSRLDPFGSSDRKMEYYFLGEGEQEEATGYLFLEFKRKNSSQYRTIGIGQKAQKGRPMGFWGFVILDGRRIGLDMNLYTSVGSKKIPLTKQELKKELGEENLFTEAQKEYMSFVNKQIFGFPRQEQYEQFVRLLIKVRAPKLSKEFKPSKVYEILNDSLQQLSDDDLRAMVEAMENMDDIQGKLNDLKLAYKDLRELRTIYNRYNCYLLGKKAQAYLEEKRKMDGMRGRLEAKESESFNKQNEMKNSQQQVDFLTAELHILETQKQALNMEELEASLDKLEEHQQNRQEAQAEKTRLSERIEDHRNKIRVLDTEKKRRRGEKELHQQETDGCIRELEEYNQVIRFNAHDSVKEFSRQREKRALSQRISGGLKELIQTVKAGGKALTDLTKVTEEWDKAEEELSKRRTAVQQAKEQLNDAEGLEHGCRDELIEGFHVKAAGSKEFVMTKDELQEITSGIYHYDGGKDRGEMIEKLHQIWHRQNQVLEKARLQSQNCRDEENDRKSQLSQELADLLEQAEPVPERTPKVEETRKRLKEKGITFLPFYQAVEFADGLKPEEKNCLEAQLADAGVLDALVVTAADYEKARKELVGWSDVLICSDVADEKPEAFGKPYAFRKPYAFLESGNIEPTLRVAVERFLSKICDGDNNYGGANRLMLAENGYFRNGILEGYSAGTAEAAFIGIDARKRKRERMIADKRRELAEVEKRFADLVEQIAETDQRIAILKDEHKNLPAFDDLEQAIELVKNSHRQLETLLEQCEKQEQFTEQLNTKKKACKQRVIEVCRPLPYRQDLEVYQGVMETIEEYERGFNILIQMAGDLELAEEKYQRAQEAIDREEENIDVDDDYHRKAEQRERELTVQIEHIEEYLNNPENKVKKERLQQLKEEEKDKKERLKKHGDNVIELRTHITILANEISELKKNAVEQIERETWTREYFQEELELGLVEKMEQMDFHTAAQKVKSCVKEMDKNRSGIEMTTILLNHFQSHISTLLSFGASMEQCFPAADFDVSALRTRQRIFFIWNGKQLHLEEFYVVIKESIESNELLIQEKDRELFEGILADTLSRKLSSRIHESRKWIHDMSILMGEMDTSMALTFSLDWKPKSAEGGMELDTKELETILSRDRELLTTEDIEKVSAHFRTRMGTAKQSAEEKGDPVNYPDLVREALDYRTWFEFKMHYYRNGENKKELTNGAFNRFSGGEKAMAMYVPLFAAVNAQYRKSENREHPRIIAMDEAFAGVDDKNISSMFEIVEKLDFDYIMNSQVLWGCYETVKSLRIAELLRPANINVVTVIYYYWDGQKRVLDEQ